MGLKICAERVPRVRDHRDIEVDRIHSRDKRPLFCLIRWPLSVCHKWTTNEVCCRFSIISISCYRDAIPRVYWSRITRRFEAVRSSSTYGFAISVELTLCEQNWHKQSINPTRTPSQWCASSVDAERSRGYSAAQNIVHMPSWSLSKYRWNDGLL